ncbi:pIX [bottlenose dolphin adenovirus 2]|uniref:PIX n=1 Tax=bottlenose dolphin adenovirus 2 TaxID=2849592 RepID=A0A0M4ME85_9ADEN|nr:pIX [Bottlenose dolphin adenovirus 1]ALE15293.1 pIX [Bottlenose dolphin adenovirus 1]
MDPGGDINTSFLTARLPRWAGVRQNVKGSDINGDPVTANDGNGSQIVRSYHVFEEPAIGDMATLARELPAARTISTSVIEEKLEELLMFMIQMKSKLDSLQTKVNFIISETIPTDEEIDNIIDDDNIICDEILLTPSPITSNTILNC